MEYKVEARLRTEPVFPDAGVYRADCPEGDCAEKQPLPELLAAVSPDKKSPAQWAYERLVLYIQNFEKTLDSRHEVALGFAGSDAGMLRIQGMGYFAPDLVTFYGTDPGGAKTQLVQHVNQLNVMLKAARTQNETATRIGFDMRAQLEKDTGETP